MQNSRHRPQARLSARRSTKGAASIALAALLFLVLLPGCTAAPNESTSAPDQASTAEGSPAAAGEKEEPQKTERDEQPSSGEGETPDDDNHDAGANIPAEVPESAYLTASALHDLVESEQKPVIADLRSGRLYYENFIAGSLHMTAGSQFDILSEDLPLGEDIFLINTDGTGLEDPWKQLVAMGHDPAHVFIIADGMQAWIDSGFATEYKKLGC